MLLLELNRSERKSLNKAKVLFVVSECPHFHVHDISQAIEVSERTCYRYMAELRFEEGIIRVSRGRYQCAKVIGGVCES